MEKRSDQSKTWGEIFRAALRRGCDHGYAAYLADGYEKRKRPLPSSTQEISGKSSVKVENKGNGGKP